MLSERNVCEVWLRDELKKWPSHLLVNLSVSHTCTEKFFFFLSVFNRIPTHDLCDAGAVLSPTGLWSHSDASRSICGARVPVKGMSERKCTWGTCWDCPASLRIISSIIIYLFIVLCSFLHSPLIFWLCDKLLLKTMTSTINWFSNFLKHILLQFHFEMFITRTLSNTNTERLRL